MGVCEAIQPVSALHGLHRKAMHSQTRSCIACKACLARMRISKTIPPVPSIGLDWIDNFHEAPSVVNCVVVHLVNRNGDKCLEEAPFVEHGPC